MKSACPDIQILFDNYQDNDLPINARIKVRRHLKNCKMCQKLLEKDKLISDMLTNLSILECPDTVVDHINNSLTQPEGAQKTQIRFGNWVRNKQ